MPNLDGDEHYDFSTLVRASKDSLLTILAETHSNLANLHIRIAFLRAEEERGNKASKTERVQFEGLRDVYSEKKWLTLKLLEHRDG